MKRRDFFKSIFGTYTAITSFFSFKYLSNKSNSTQQNNKLLTKINFKRRATGVILEFPIVHHCNLNCAYCDHFASIAPVHKISVKDFQNDVKKISKITNGEIKEIWILGGEPLLHDEIDKIFEIARKYFKNTNIKMLTNGLLLDKQKDAFWKSCKNNNIKIVVENYIYNKEKINFEVIKEKLRRFNCLLSFDSPKYQFRKMNLTKEKTHNINHRYNKCQCKLWPILDNGKFYPCSVVNGVDKFFNKKFPDLAFPIAQKDVLDIHKINSMDELLEFYETPKEMCAHCNYFLSEGEKWRLSKQEASEWYQG